MHCSRNEVPLMQNHRNSCPWAQESQLFCLCLQSRQVVTISEDFANLVTFAAEEHPYPHSCTSNLLQVVLRPLFLCLSPPSVAPSLPFLHIFSALWLCAVRCLISNLWGLGVIFLFKGLQCSISAVFVLQSRLLTVPIWYWRKGLCRVRSVQDW